MKWLEKVFLAGHLLVIAMFLVCGGWLIWQGMVGLWHGAFGAQAGGNPFQRFNAVLDCIGLLTIALVAIELAQTIFEEEVQRDVKISGPTRVRRYLSRFLVVIVIALSIETLISAFEAVHEGPEGLLYSAAIGGCAAMLLIAWGVFIRLNRSAEELEPEAMADTKREDDQVQ